MDVNTAFKKDAATKSADECVGLQKENAEKNGNILRVSPHD
jgi:hypothetical protein